MGIDWQSVLTTALVGSTAAATISAAVGWVLKTVITEWLARDTEAFKTRLKADTEVEIERLKNSLQIAAIEREVMFSNLHKRRAEVIEQLYKQLTQLHSSAEVFVVTSENNPSREEHKEHFAKVRGKIVDYLSFVQENRIFMPTAVCDLLSDHLVRIRRAVHTAGSYGGREYLDPNSAEKSSEAFMKVYMEFNEDIPAAQKLLEAEFRRMLGVE